MFGIGPQELIIIGLLALVIFGPKKLPRMAKELGRFVNEARNYTAEFKSELTSSGETKGPQRPVEKSESAHSPEQFGEDDRHRKP